jgi:hypothetical protein
MGTLTENIPVFDNRLIYVLKVKADLVGRGIAVGKRRHCDRAAVCIKFYTALYFSG